MTKIESFMEFCDDMIIAEESFSDFASAVSKLASLSLKAVVALFEEISSHMIMMASNLKGMYINKNSYILMNQIIKEFDTIIDNCTYDVDKLFRGLDNLNEGIYTPESLASGGVKQRMAKIDQMAESLRIYKETLSQEKDKFNPVSYAEGVKLQKDIYRITMKIKSLTKTVKLTMNDKKKIEMYNMSEMAQYLLSYNKESIYKMSSVLFDAYANLRVKPAK